MGKILNRNNFFQAKFHGYSMLKLHKRHFRNIFVIIKWYALGAI